VSIKDHIIMTPMASFDLYWPHVRFLWGSVNLVAITTLSNHTPSFEVVCWRENEEA
jgi:hypothetical protein